MLARRSHYITLLSLAFLNFITYSLAPDTLWCYSSLLTYSQRKTNSLVVECYIILSRVISLAYVTGISNGTTGWVILCLSLFFLFMTLLENDKSYMLFVCQQKCCEGIKERGWYREGEQTNACLFVTQPPLSSTQHTQTHMKY